MTDFDISTLALSWITTYGSPAVAGVLLLAALGLPLPATLLLIASGAFIRQEYLNPYSTPVLGLAGTVLGDTLLYGVGYFASTWVERRFGGSPNWIKARAYFELRGGWATFLTRWLLTAIATPITLIAGGSSYTFKKFLLIDFAGELTWIVLYGGLGYIFGSQWELISDFITNFSGAIMGLFVLGLGVYVLLRFSKKNEKATE